MVLWSRDCAIRPGVDSVSAMARVFVGSEAVAAGRVSKYELRTRFQRILPDVYVPRGHPLTLLDRTTATWLWSRRQGVITGAAASALHGAQWVADDIVIELNWPDRKSPPGVIARTETLLPEELDTRHGIVVTSVARTAYDLARRGPVDRAVERLDALAAATHFKADDVIELARAHPHVRESRRVARVLDLVDAGAQSPKETWLRVMLIGAGYPRPSTQIPVPGPDGYPRYYLDMGWPEVRVAVEYDGEHHRLDPVQYRHDIIRAEYIASLGWRRVTVVAGDRRAEILRRVARAWALSRP